MCRPSACPGAAAIMEAVLVADAVDTAHGSDLRADLQDWRFMVMLSGRW